MVFLLLSRSVLVLLIIPHFDCKGQQIIYDIVSSV